MVAELVNVGGEKGSPLNFFDPNTVEEDENLLRRTLKPYGTMVCGPHPMWYTTIVVSKTEDLGLVLII